MAARRYSWVCLLCAWLFACQQAETARREVADKQLALSEADCPSGYRIIRGTLASETLSGTSGNDCILGFDGNDTINGNGGNDFIIGGNGNDTLRGGNGNDQLHGESGDDQLYGDSGDDTLSGAEGDDYAAGGIGRDNIEGGVGRDRLYGGDTEDTIRGGPDDDLIHGDAANDQLYGDDGHDVIDGDANTDTIWGGNGDDAIYGDIGSDTLFGEAGDDALIGGSGTNTTDGGVGIDACAGVSCEKPELALSACTQDNQCASGTRCIADFGLCLGCVSDQDSDGRCDSQDGCPTDAAKTAPGICGCGAPDTDSDGDGAANCQDGCPNDAAKTSAGICGCGVSDADGDGDGSANCQDGCPADPAKTLAGTCGCGVSDADADGDGTANCQDGCANDPAKVSAGVCGCGVSDADGDADGTANCQDGCPSDPGKTAAGVCGCGIPDANVDGDGALDCLDECPSDPSKVALGTCGCGIPDADTDGDGTANCVDGCAADPAKIAAGICGCGVSDADADGDGTANCQDGCPSDPAKTAAGVCGCGNSDADADGDGIANCQDGCPNDPAKIAAGICGCGMAEADSDLDGRADCVDRCAGYDDAADQDGDGTPDGCDLPTDCTAGTVGLGVYQGGVQIHDAEDIAALAGVTCITGSLVASFSTLTSFEGLESLTAVAGDVRITFNSSLQELRGLEHLARIGGQLDIQANDQLATLEHLVALTSLGTQQASVWFPLHVFDNPVLPACWAWTLASQTGIPCTGQPDGGMCAYNRGTGSCGSLPGDFECVPGASGPGVYDGSVDARSPYPVELAHMGGVTCITGNVMLAGSALTDLNVLSNLQMVGGNLHIAQAEQLTSLDGLERLTSVGGSLLVIHNPLLEDLAALSQLRSVGARLDPWQVRFEVSYNERLPGCWAWELERWTGTRCGSSADGNYGFRCGSNHGDGSCGSLPDDFECVEGAQGPGVYYGAIQSFGDGDLREFGGVTCAIGSVNINQTSDLRMLRHLQSVGGHLNISGNPELTSLAGLERLTDVGMLLTISNNPALRDLSALANLRTVASAWPAGAVVQTISNNASLPACQVWALGHQTGHPCIHGGYEDFCGGNRGRGSCGSLPADFECVPGAVGPGVFDGYVTSGAGLEEYGGVTCITGDLAIWGEDFADLTLLETLQKVGGSVHIASNPQLASLHGLEQLDEVGGRLRLESNPQLQNLTGLSGLTRLGATLPPYEPPIFVEGNDALPPCQAWNLASQSGTNCLWDGGGGYVENLCEHNNGAGGCGSLPADFECVPGARGPGVVDGHIVVGGGSSLDLSAFRGVTCVTGDLRVYGPLADPAAGLQVLSTLHKVGGLFQIQSQSWTDVDALSQLTEVGGQLDIHFNAQLSDLSGLNNLTRLGTRLAPDQQALSIGNNDALPACRVWALEQQTGKRCGGTWSTCSYNFGTGSCGSLPPEVACVPGAVGPGVYDGSIDWNGSTAEWQFREFGGLTCVTGDLRIYGTQLGDLGALEYLQAVGGDLEIAYNALTSLDGLQNLTEVGDSLRIMGNQSLQDLAGLASLASLGVRPGPEGSALLINGNSALPACWVGALEEQTSQSCGQSAPWVAECDGNDGSGSCPP